MAQREPLGGFLYKTNIMLQNERTWLFFKAAFEERDALLVQALVGQTLGSFMRARLLWIVFRHSTMFGGEGE